jgi:hypothetical protein
MSKFFGSLIVTALWPICSLLAEQANVCYSMAIVLIPSSVGDSLAAMFSYEHVFFNSSCCADFLALSHIPCSHPPGIYILVGGRRYADVG